MATHFWPKEEKAQAALPSAHECSTEAQKHWEFTIWALQSTTVAVSAEGNVFSDPEKPYYIKMNRNVRIRTNFQNNRVRVKL